MMAPGYLVQHDAAYQMRQPLVNYPCVILMGRDCQYVWDPGSRQQALAAAVNTVHPSPGRGPEGLFEHFRAAPLSPQANC